MEEKRIRTGSYRRNREAHILSQIVDAMLETAADLRDATVDDWTRILADACRRHKRTADISAAATC